MSYETTNIAETLAEKAGETVTRAQKFAENAGDEVRDRAGKAAAFGQERIQESPFVAVLIAFIAGIALTAVLSPGFLWNRKD